MAELRNVSARNETHQEQMRLAMAAKHAALNELRRRHEEEYQVLLSAEKRKRGLGAR